MMCAEAALPHSTGALPFSPRKGKRKGKLPKHGRRGQETRLPPDVWLEVWFARLVALPTSMPKGHAPRSLESAPSVSSARLRGPGGGPRAPGPGTYPEKSERKKVDLKFLCPVPTQSHPKRWFSSLPWALKNSVGGKKKGCSCEPSPPRLAAGAGDRNAETLKDFYVLGLLEAISERFSSGQDHQLHKLPK